MNPVKLPNATHTLHGPPGSDIGDLDVIISAPYVMSVWEPTPEERAAIAAGRNILLSIMANGMPPAALQIAPALCPHCNQPVETGATEHAICGDIVRAGTEPKTRHHGWHWWQGVANEIDCQGQPVKFAKTYAVHCWSFNGIGYATAAHWSAPIKQRDMDALGKWGYEIIPPKFQ